ncbi:glutamate/gamma-aminobutyrate family transporter YjeM [Ligilactobacillus apodemi]|uniref:Inner membrane transporter YjeM n=1 Tax=Ligilactobacillus apodemi DSM 16634 = JCM 16172 TaxID=1423724 RepID=A0A0R1U034_9LACO|nr:glutamate/gamma-aminobutyrate family transporter YjeM [Ligilactobacillus apodemi]KRL84226.1 inner membrane transporter YjeM [Ligilactobacillus apodemi DSM 16634 = JCM 16172]
MKKDKIKLFGLVMMIFSAIFGFANTTVAYEQMGYGSILWYIVASLLFFLPCSLMLAEYGAAFKEAKGGIYSWLAGSIDEKMAFIGTFIWLSSWVVWLVSTSSKVWIPLSALLSGADKTGSWHLFGLDATQTIGLLGIIWILAITFFCTRGMDFIAKIGSIGGIFTIALNVIFCLASIIILVMNHGKLAQPIHGLSSFTTSPNPEFSTTIALLSFIVYAIFAYAGMESMGGVMDDVDKPAKTFPKAVIISTVVIALSYSLMILMWGISTNWQSVIGNKNANLGNITYVLMNNLGVVLGNSLHLSNSTSLLLGDLMTRFAGLGMFIGYLGAFFILVYSPIKSFILGSDQKLWPKKMTKLNRAGMPAFSMWLQAGIVCVFIFLVAFGGSAAQKFYTILTDMANVSTSCPYLFLIGAFPFFKKKKDIERPFEVYKSQLWTNIITIFVMIVLAAGIIFTCVEPILEHQYDTAFWTIIGPVFFGVVAWLFYQRLTVKGK